VALQSENRTAGNSRTPVVITFPADLITPVRAFLALTRPGEEAFLLESVAGGESQARYSFVGLQPAEVFEAGEHAHLRRNDGTAELPGEPRAALSAWIESFGSGLLSANGVPFLGGAVGWMDFSAFAFSEPTLCRSFPRPRNARIVFGLFTAGFVLDHLRQEGHLYRLPRDGEAESESLAHLQDLKRRLEGPLGFLPQEDSWIQTAGPDRNRFFENVAKAKAAIHRGDAYQIVLSEPFEGSFLGDPFAVYRRLRRLNPSPYHFYVSLGGRQVVGSSPEMLVRVERGEVTTVPIAGTRPRGSTPDEDARLEHELLRDPKELAEHAMLVDLARNDLGRVCEFGSVTVPVRGSIEKFSHVMHLTSEVRGALATGRSALDALWSTFPAGTVSGAPKIRAAEILSELESQDRGLYGGAVGIMDTAGDIEMCIAIRTLEFGAGTVRFRSGAGIVADSQEEAEWGEIHHKAKALLSALAGPLASAASCPAAEVAPLTVPGAELQGGLA
jgi:anthranilate synthase component 1